MGSSPSAFLAYGYDLGSDDEWKIGETDEYGGIDASNASALAWYDDSEDADGFIEQAERRLLAEIAGFTETWETWTGEGNFFTAEGVAKERLGVAFERYSYGEYPMFVLASKVIDVGDDTAKVVDLAELAAHPDRPKWDAALFDAVKTLGITPNQERPSWLLGALYS